MRGHSDLSGSCTIDREMLDCMHVTNNASCYVDDHADVSDATSVDPD